MESLEQKIARLTSERVELADYDPSWPQLFEEEKRHLLDCLPAGVIGRIEHFGSTAIPNLAAKPIIDMLIEVSSLEQTKQRIVPILTEQDYEYVWRPTFGDRGPPWYAWFIKRENQSQIRTHHLHMVEPSFAEHWNRIYFRDYLRDHPDVAVAYELLKRRSAANHPNDRVAYTREKSEFIAKTTQQAIDFFATTNR